MGHTKTEGRGATLAATRITSEPVLQLPKLPTPPSPPSRRPYGPGDTIDGKYRLESLLGQGGMGEVWTARNDTLGVLRAVKLIRADADGPESTDRLLHEARAAATLTDPAIVRVFDFGRTSFGDPYIVMEVLEGEDLMRVINRREKLSPSKAVRVLLPVIRALAAAHAHGIVHRDLKPENIFLAKLADGRVQPKLLDFGIAKLKNARALRLTTEGAVVGSPLYMSPEQARAEDVDERADIWAVCVVLYEAITGCTPFGGDDRKAVFHAVKNEEPKSLTERGVADGALWPILRRGLAKPREERFQSMEELGKSLARWLLDAGITDDITGASLEAGWFRSSRHSLFASSLPPNSPLLELPSEAGADLPSDAGTPQGSKHAEPTPPQSGLERLVARVPRLGSVIAAARQLDRRRRAALGAALLTLLAGVVLIAAQSDAPAEAKTETPATPVTMTAPPPPADTPATPEVAPPAAPEIAVAPAPATPPAATEAGASAASTRPKAPARKASRSRARPPAASKDARRSKLIDPYQ